jgi:hypothetical protein
MSKERWNAFLRHGVEVCAGGRAGVAGVTIMRLAAAGLVLLVLSSASIAQNGAQPASAADSVSESVRVLSEQIRDLRASVEALRLDSQQARAESLALRREVEQLRAGTGAPEAVVAEAAIGAEDQVAAGSPMTAGLQDGGQESSARAARLEEQYELLSGKLDDQYQTKVESASKYRLRISGIVLMNLFSNQGTVDSADLPTLAYARPAGGSGGSFGATLRQSEIGFEVFGPQVAGARTRGDLQLDVAGGFAAMPNGINSGLMRLRTATMRMDWENTSVVAGQDGLFFSPNSPTSFATLAQPALTYAGNLWSWVPQIRVEHRVALGEGSSLLLQGGILDPVSGDVPGGTTYRVAGPGEASWQPAYGTRVAWTRNVFGRPLRIGVGGYYGRQEYGFGRRVDGWAAMSDLELPLGSKFEVSGKMYRGRALGGLYGGLGQSVLFSGTNTGNVYTEVIGLNSVGGWAQLKYRAAAKVEFNAAFGVDNPFAKDLEYFQSAYSYGDPTVWRNRAGFANVIYRPRSDLLFSAEYRQIETNSLVTGLSGAGHLNLMMGVLF